MAGIFLYLKHVAGLLDRCYEREAMLHANHIHSFAPLLRFDEQLAGSPEELSEHRAFLIRHDKAYLWPDKAAAAAFNAGKDEAMRRAEESGNIWKSEPTAFLRRRRKMQLQQSERFREVFAPYKAAQADLFREEVQRFSTALSMADQRRDTTTFQVVLAWLRRRNTAFCKAVFASQEAAAGLTLDRKLSTSAAPTFSKVLAQHWKVSLQIDGQNLNLPFGGSSADPGTGEVSHHGPWVDALIGIRLLKPSVSELGKQAGLQFASIFPVPNHYHFMCRDLRELEATIRIYIEMFRLIEPELEAALIQDSAERAA